VIKPNDYEGTEQFEANGRNNEQVHGSDVRRLIAQKCLPASGALVRRPRPAIRKVLKLSSETESCSSDNYFARTDRVIENCRLLKGNGSSHAEVAVVAGGRVFEDINALDVR
jgi:hypothetical protein